MKFGSEGELTPMDTVSLHDLHHDLNNNRTSFYRLQESKNFFDFADEDIMAYTGKASAPTFLNADPGHVDMVAMDDFMETTFIDLDPVKLNDLHTSQDVVVSAEEVVMTSNIPSTALELVVNRDGDVIERATFTLPDPVTPLTPASPFCAPSTPSCYSDDVSSCPSDVSTPDVVSLRQEDVTLELLPVSGDDKMATAAMTALRECSLTPLIKEELKYTIQSRRLAAGKPELVVDNTPAPKVRKEMTHEERERSLKRREQNRVAAQRFRKKQDSIISHLSLKCQRLENSNSHIRSDIQRLSQEKEELKLLLTSHLHLCPLAPRYPAPKAPR